MKKKVFALFAVLGMAIGLIGCGGKDDETATTEASVDGVTPQEEIVQLVNVDLPGIAEERDSAVAIYNGYFEGDDDKDSETWRDQLENQALTSYDSYLEKLGALTYSSSEVQTLKDLYQKSAESQRDAIAYVVEALKEADTDQLDSAQQSISDSKTYLKMYEDTLSSTCEKYGITIVGDFQTSTMTDATSTDAD